MESMTWPVSQQECTRRGAFWHSVGGTEIETKKQVIRTDDGIYMEQVASGQPVDRCQI